MTHLRETREPLIRTGGEFGPSYGFASLGDPFSANKEPGPLTGRRMNLPVWRMPTLEREGNLFLMMMDGAD